MQLSAAEEAAPPGPLLGRAAQDGPAADVLEAKYKRAKHLLRVQAQHVAQLQGAAPAVPPGTYAAPPRQRLRGAVPTLRARAVSR